MVERMARRIDVGIAVRYGLPMTGPDTAPDERTIATLTKRYEDKLQDIANRLADLAREVSREGKARPTVLNDDGQTDYIYAAERAMHALHWGIANVNADGLIGTAADAHNAVRGRWK